MLKNLHFHLTLYSQIPNKSFIVKWILARKMPFPAPFFVALTIMVRLFLHSLKQMMKQIHKKPSLMVQMLDRPKKKTGTPTGNLSPPRAICMRRSSLWNTNINYKQENKSVKLQESLTQEKILHGCTTFFCKSMVIIYRILYCNYFFAGILGCTKSLQSFNLNALFSKILQLHWSMIYWVYFQWIIEIREGSTCI